MKGLNEHCWMWELYAAYTTWAVQAGYTLIQSQQLFRRNLEHLGFKSSRGNRGQRVNGLARVPEEIAIRPSASAISADQVTACS